MNVDDSMDNRNANNEVRQQAELWFARRLEPSVREAESGAFERWLAEDPRHAKAYTDTERLWARLAVLKRSARLRESSVPAVAAPPRRLQFIYGIAASIAIFAVGIATYALYTRAVPVQAFISALGEQRTETLEDGTTLRLNTSSVLGVRMTSSRREVKLERGEAAFDVATDVSRPFVVSAGDGTITAVGTLFQVGHEDERVTVPLMEGGVQLARESRGEFEWLEPGQQATFRESSRGIVRRNVDVKAFTSWMNGRLEFRNTPLADAIAEANRYSARKIRSGDSSIDRIAVSGTFRTDDVEGMAAAFAGAFPVRAEIGPEEIVLYAK